MSSSIRPPGAPPPGSPGLLGINDLKPGQASDAPQTGQVTGGPRGAEAPPEAAVGSPTGEWLRRLEVGDVTKAQAVDGLVAQALEAHGGAGLSAAQRAELSEVLRSALLEDPVLGELLGG